VPYVVLVALIVQAVLWAGRQGNGEEQASAPHDPYATNWGYVLGVWCIVPAFVVGCLVGVFAGAIWALPISIAGFVILFPTFTANALLVPLGLYQAAYWVVSRLSHVRWGYDRFQGGAAFAARAVIRMPPTPEAIAWVEAKLPGPDVSVTPGAALAAGLLADARGDREGARRLLEAVESFEPRLQVAVARKMATEWLVVDAAATGDWERVHALASAPEALRTGAVVLLNGIALRRLGRPGAPSNLALWAAWAMAGARSNAVPVVRATAEAPPGPPRRSPQPVTEPSEPLARALSRHAALVGRERPTREEVVAVAKAWDEALADEALTLRIERRGAEIGARNAFAARSRLAEEVQEDLVALAKAAGVPLADLPGDTVAAAARKVRDELLSELESIGGALSRRVEGRRALPPMDELREFVTLRAAWDRASRQGGPEVRRLAFRSIHDPVCSLAVWLFNERGQRALANLMFRWLLHEAMAVGDARAVELEAKNVRCGY
jgi:hypothetical protein